MLFFSPAFFPGISHFLRNPSQPTPLLFHLKSVNFDLLSAAPLVSMREQ